MKKIFINGILLFPSIIILLVLVLYLLTGYNTFMSNAIASIGEQRHEEDIKNLISKNKFNLICLFAIGIIFLNLVIVYYKSVIVKSVSHFFNYTKPAIANRLRLIKKDKAWFLFLIPFFYSVYMALYFPVTYDEAYNYLNYSGRGFLSTIGYYITPNNHILNSLLAYFMLFIPSSNELLLIRIPTMFFSLMSLLFGYSFMREYFDKNKAMFFTAILSAFYYWIRYSFLCRGYSLLDFCFLIMLYSAFKIINENKKIYWTYFSLAGIAGFYVMPSFLYPFVTVNGLLLILSFKNLKTQIISGVIVGVTVILLYVPVILINGLDALINNRFVKQIDRSEVIHRLIPFLFETIKSISGINSFIILAVIALSFLLMIKGKQKTQIITLLVFFVAPFVLLIAHSVIPFPRVLIYYAFVLAFCGALPLDKIMTQLNTALLITICLTIQVAGVINFHFINLDHEAYSIQINNDLKILDQGKNFIVDDWDFDPYFLFHKVTEQKDMTFHYIPNLPVNVDTLSIPYDFAIIDSRFDSTRITKPKINYEYYHIYSR